MINPHQPYKTLRTPRNKRAFTLVEIMIVVVIIGLLAAMAIPAMQRVRLQSQASTIANNFRVFSESFLRFSLENGTYPPSDWTQGAYPTGMSSHLPGTWVLDTPVGGYFAFENGLGLGTPPTIILVQSDLETDFMQAVDDKVDDGNLGTGFIRGDSQSLDFIIE